MHTLDPTLRYDMVRTEQAHRVARSTRSQLAGDDSQAHPSHRARHRVALRHRLAVATAAAIVLLGTVASAWAAGSPAAETADPVPCVRVGTGWAC